MEADAIFETRSRKIVIQQPIVSVVLIGGLRYWIWDKAEWNQSLRDSRHG